MNPAHLTCPYCPAQAFPAQGQPILELTLYICPAKHKFFIEAGDITFNYGHNIKERES
jgi:hypothetical protein